MTATTAAPVDSAGSSDDESKQRLIDDLAARLAAIESRTPRGGSHGASSPIDASGESDPMHPNDRGRAPGRSRPAAASMSIGGSGTVGPTRRDRRKGGDPAGHPEDDLGDPEAVARAICLRLLTGAARPRAGLAAALRLRGIADEVAERVLDRFTEVGLIDDKAYADAFVAAKHRERALGAAALRTELRRKGVDEETVLDAVHIIDHDAERERARALIGKKVDAAMAHGEPAARRRLVSLLARRGYTSELAFAVVNEALAVHRQDQHPDGTT